MRLSNRSRMLLIVPSFMVAVSAIPHSLSYHYDFFTTLLLVVAGAFIGFCMGVIIALIVSVVERLGIQISR